MGGEMIAEAVFTRGWRGGRRGGGGVVGDYVNAGREGLGGFHGGAWEAVKGDHRGSGTRGWVAAMGRIPSGEWVAGGSSGVWVRRGGCDGRWPNQDGNHDVGACGARLGVAAMLVVERVRGGGAVGRLSKWQADEGDGMQSSARFKIKHYIFCDLRQF